MIESFQQNLTKDSTIIDIIIDQDNLKDIIKQEFEWLQTELTQTINSPIVSSHCDLLSGNIIIPKISLLTNNQRPHHPHSIYQVLKIIQ